MTPPKLFLFLITALVFQTPAHGQVSLPNSSYSVVNLGKSAAFGRPDERNLGAVARMAPKPGGGLYVQWATAQGWNRGYGKITSTVYVTEVDANGRQVGEDILLGPSEPAGIVATNDGFAYYLKDQHRLTFGRYTGRQKTSEVILMDHAVSGERRPTSFRTGVELRDPQTGEFRFGWAVPYAPFARGHGGLAFGSNVVGTIFCSWNNYQPEGHPPAGGWSNPNDAHMGSTAWFYGSNPAHDHHMSYATGDHSLDQRMIHAEGNFYSVSLNPHIVFQRFDTQGNRSHRQILFDRPVSYNSNGLSSPDTGAMEVLRNGVWDPKTNFLEARGYTLGRLGDLHALGNNRFALTYGYASWSDKRGIRSSKNQVDVAILDGSGNVVSRNVVAQPDTRAGQNGFTEYFPYERIRWVKSAKAGPNILVVWATERSGSSRLPVYMTVVNQNGDVLQRPAAVPEGIPFSTSDRLHNLADGSIAWTATNRGNLELHRFFP